MKPKRSLSIATQITLGLIAVVELSLIVTGGTLIYISFQSGLSQLHLTQQAHAQVISSKVAAYVDDLQRGLTYLARVRGLSNFNAVTQRELLEGLTLHDSAYQLVGLTDSQGHLQQELSRTGEPVLANWSATAAFRRAYQEEEDFIGPVEVDAQHPWASLLLAVPVRNGENTVDGILFARIDLKYLWAVLDETVLSDNSYVYVVDRRQFVIAQSGGLPAQFNFIDLSQNPLGRIFESGSSTLPDTYRGLRQVDVLGDIANVPVTNWHVVVEVPVTAAYQPLFMLLEIMGLCLLAGAAAAAVGGLTISRQIVSPLSQLTEAAAQIEGGNLDVTVAIHRNNELGLLARTFNKMSVQLREVVTQLQQDILHRKLVEEALAAKNKELENYLYVASHDLRSPLVNIQGFSQRLQKQVSGLKTALEAQPLEEKTRQDFEKITGDDIPRTLDFISTNVSKMDTLISGLLQISRTGQVKMAVQKIDMNQMMENLIRGFSFQVEAIGGKALVVQDLPDCYGDEQLLIQLFSNIIANAIKYRDKNRPLVITISAQTHDHKIIYNIQDNGIGIAPRHLERVWDVFYRVDSRSPEAGDGLGLSIVKTIVDKHNGKVGIESKEGEGSTLHIELPGSEFFG